MTDRERHGESARDPGPVVFVLFGATGDLARRMVLPAFYRLAGEGPDRLAAVWDVAEPLLSAPPAVSTYPPRSWGPAPARDLITPGRWLLGQ
jgi:glucose-6-phosphate 1-dehydrogenase